MTLHYKESLKTAAFESWHGCLAAPTVDLLAVVPRRYDQTMGVPQLCIAFNRQ